MERFRHEGSQGALQNEVGRVIDAAHRFQRPTVTRNVRPIGLPEAELVVEFEGLTENEMRAALAAFPGGRRFVLAS